MKPALLATALMAASLVQAQADNLDGNTLLEACQSPKAEGLFFFCTGYVLGIVEGVKWGSTLNIFAAGTAMSTSEVNEFSDALIGYCNPATATLNQHIDIVVKFLVDHPEKRHESARSLATEAFQLAFPCNKS